MSRTKLKETNKPFSTGPIDDPLKEDAGTCPNCKEDTLWYYPHQKGPCYSGLVTNEWLEHYGCENPDCCAIFFGVEMEVPA